MTIDSTKSFFSQSEYMALTPEQRQLLRERFNIGRSGSSRVETRPGGDNVHVSDGTEPSDLMASVNLKTVCAFLGHEYKEGQVFDFNLLMNEVKHKLFGSPAPTGPVHIEREPIPEKKSEVKEESKKDIVVSQKKKKK